MWVKKRHTVETMLFMAGNAGDTPVHKAKAEFHY